MWTEALLLMPLLSAAAPHVDTRDPGPSARCPADMRLVRGTHFDEVEHLCIDWRKSVGRCFAYYEHLTVANGPTTRVDVCMDRFEAPNEEGKRPLVMRSLGDAEAFCKAREKRLCTEAEWETACESGDHRPWQYGWKVDKRVCNSDKSWREFDASALAAGGETARREVERLWQGSEAGAYPECVTKDGIHDLMGNVEEWVTSSRRRKHPGALMGGFWAKPWTGCRGTNDAHEPNFVFYEVGFRCCKEPTPEAPAREETAP